MKPKKFYVYVYRDPRPGKGKVPIYVGKGKGTRSDIHLFPSKNPGRTLNRIIAKCRVLGLKPIVRIGAYFDNEKDALKHEMTLIALYGRRDLGAGTLCNLTDGGEGTSGWVPSKRVRQAISARVRALHKSNPDYTAAITKGWHKWWSDPKIQKEYSDRIKELMRTPERLAQISSQGKKNCASPKFQAIRQASLKKLNSDPIFRKRRAKRLRQQNADPVFQKDVQRKRRVWIDKPSTRADMRRNYDKNKKAILAGVSNYWSDPKNRAKQAERMRLRNLDPKHQAACRAGYRADPENRVRRAEATRLRNLDPKFQALCQAGRRK